MAWTRSKDNNPARLVLMHLFLLCVVGGSICFFGKNKFDDVLENELNLVLQANQKKLQDWSRERKRLLQTLVNEPSTQKKLNQLLSIENGQEDLGALEEQLDWGRNYFGSVGRSFGFSDIALYDLNGHAVISYMDPSLQELDSIKNSECFKKATLGETTLSLLVPRVKGGGETTVARNKRTLNIFAPVRSGEGTVKGVLALTDASMNSLNDVLGVSRVGDSGEVYLFDKKGGMVSNSRFNEELVRIGLIGKKENMESAFYFRILDPGQRLQPVDRLLTPEDKKGWLLTKMAQDAIRGNHGIDLEGYNDYRGKRVVGTWTWFPEMSLGMTYEMDEDEAYSLMYSWFQFFGTIFVLLSLFSIMILMMQIRQRTIKKERERVQRGLEEAQDELQTQNLVKEKILAERQKFFDMLENLPVMFHLQASDYSIPYANKLFRESFGYNLEKKCFQMMHKREEPCGKCTPFTIFDSKKTENAVWESNNGRCYLTVMTPFSDVDGSSLVMEMAVDITEQKDAEKQLRSALNELQIANHAKDEFLSRVSHELRTPMNAILGFSNLLILEEDHSLDTTQKEYLKYVVSSGKHLMKMIDEILDLSKIQSDNMRLNIKKVNVHRLVEEAVERVESMAQDNRVALDVKMETTDLFVHADEIRLSQVILNLLTNGIKYNKEAGTVTIFSRVKEERLHLSFEDTGVGISNEKLVEVFTPFERLGNEFSNIPGTGLGLSISKKVIELMGGEIQVTSQLGQGSCFTMILPLADDRLSVDLDGVRSKSKAQPKESFTGEGKRILHIEDNPVNLDLVKNILRQRPDVILLEANEPYAGLTLAREHLIDLILLDINLPEMDGFDVLKKLKSGKLTQNIPVVAISADAMPHDVDRALKEGFDAYLTKPIDVQQFLGVVDQYIGEGVKKGAGK